MRLCRFNKSKIGIVRDEVVHDVTAITDKLGRQFYPLPNHDLLIAALFESPETLENVANAAVQIPLAEVALEAPVANPGKLMAAPVNYMDHKTEAEEELMQFFQQKVELIHSVGLFLKATSSLIGQSQPVRLRFDDRRNDHELELAVIIGKTCDRVSADRALDYVAGYSVGLDMTVRGKEERSMRKSIDSYSPLGPWLVTADELGDPGSLAMNLKVNGEMRQQANTRDLVLSVPELIEYASRYYTLQPGDVIYTGTPAGVAPVNPGDVIEAYIEKIGTLRMLVEAL